MSISTQSYSITKDEAIEILLDYPVEFAHLLGFTKLTDLHNDWIIDIVQGSGDATLQGHRGSYKTTCLSVGLSEILIVAPNDKTLFMRKTDNDVKEIIAQISKILESRYTQACVEAIYRCPLSITASNATEITTNLCEHDPRGSAQITAMGIGGSLTGKHYDRIFTDDIVNIKDRISRAEREHTKAIYQELQNLKNRDGRIYNTGTPWHKDDCFKLMPNPKKYDCYSTGLISKEELADIKSKMTASLFSANYELKHIASEDVIFRDPQLNADPALVEQGNCHIDASYGGSDGSAFTICRKQNGKYYVLGKLRHQHIDDCEDEFIKIRKAFNAGKISCEDNGDKGYLGKELRNKGERTHVYHENMNKYLKITTYLKAEWKNVIFVEGTDEEYIDQICEYNENAEHDDCPDSLASAIRELWAKKDTNNKSSYLS